MEALLFTMYFAAVTSLTPKKCLDLFQEERDCLLDRYRYAAEIAFANAKLFIDADMTTLQALAIFLVSKSTTRLNYSMLLRTPVNHLLFSKKSFHPLKLHGTEMNAALRPLPG